MRPYGASGERGISHARRPIRVSIATKPAVPPSANDARREREQDWQAKQVRMMAVEAAARVFVHDRFPLDVPLLVLASQIEHYILTGETEEPKP